ncbi:hypothetical protein IEO21_05736 [Rhodonia placenta]|uniref:Elongin-A n=1 Tax=Rhodonia placenta TaxID=104341 RepID=A0A8H7P1B0_9APHY|nr:hypothetical protein IEO21_05736 [Postia placenta]
MLDVDQQGTLIPSLVQLCQRLAANHADSIHSIGDGRRYDLLKPILGNCSPETLLRIEQSNPEIEENNNELWERLCFRTYPIAAEQFRSDTVEEPGSWREQFFLLREMETKRFEQLGTRLRTIRQEEAERKKETQIKLTDKLPASKRARTWGAYQPKTLLQKTRSDAARLQKGIYGTRLIPPMHTTKTWRATSSGASIKPALHPTTSTASSSSTRPGSRVTVTSVSIRRPIAKTRPSITTVLSDTKLSSSSTESHTVSSPPAVDDTCSSTTLPTQTSPCSDVSAPPKRPSLGRKDPMAALFMPKHRAHSQRPSQVVGSRTVSSRT